MSRVHIQRPHSLGSQEVKRRFDEVEASLQQHYGLTIEWDGLGGAFHGHGVTGQVHVAEDHIVIDMRLGIMLWPFTHRIQESLEQQVDRLLES
ncbi:MAG: polyhydroxyalkanoic acid system family protein [Acidobacteria bacterium]|nr:polyhydroxyalkanoic acid system family protein [Acidobacteriota bacterium]